jgi:nitrogen PTS system EIIA component
MAVPHTRDFVLTLTHDVVIFAFPEKPIPYGALDGEPVHTLIFLFACNDKRHLHLLAKIVHLSSQKHIRKMLQDKPNKEKLLEFIESWEGAIPNPQEA